MPRRILRSRGKRPKKDWPRKIRTRDSQYFKIIWDADEHASLRNFPQCTIAVVVNTSFGMERRAYELERALH